MLCRTVVFVLVFFSPLLANAAAVDVKLENYFGIGVAYEPASGNLLLIEDRQNTEFAPHYYVSRYSTTGTLIDTTEFPFSVDGIDVLPNGDWLLMSRGSQGTIATYNPETEDVSSVAFPNDGEFEGMAFDPNRGTIFFTQDDGDLIEVTLEGLDGPDGTCGLDAPRCWTPEHENLGFDPRSNRLIGLGSQTLDFMNHEGHIINSVPVDGSLLVIDEGGDIERSLHPQSISVDGQHLYALYLDWVTHRTTVRVMALPVFNDLADLAIIRAGLGTEFDRGDFAEAVRNLGTVAQPSVTASQASVPEPTTLTLAVLGLIGCAMRWRRWRR